MLKIRPFRLTLYGLLLVTLGGGLVIYGARIADNDRLSYAEMIEQMASNANTPATQQAPPSLELWDVGRSIMFAGSLFAIPGGLLLLLSAGIYITHRFILPRIETAVEEAQAAREKRLGGSDDEDVQDEDAAAGEQEVELGQELLQASSEAAPKQAEEGPSTIIELEQPGPDGGAEAETGE